MFVQLANKCRWEAYEREKMVPTTTNRDVAGCTMAELLHYVPSAFGIKAFATRIAICCLEDRVRIAMMCVKFELSEHNRNTHSFFL